jgi:hypothetical protein
MAWSNVANIKGPQGDSGAATWADIVGKPTNLVTGVDNGTPIPLIIWKGTQAEYDAIVTKDPNTFYGITEV